MGRPPKSSTLKRIQMDMSPSVVKRLKDLQQITEATSYAEVVRVALKIYEHVLHEQQNGGEIILRNNGQERILLHLT